jgi:hypothetical protein
MIQSGRASLTLVSRDRPTPLGKRSHSDSLMLSSSLLLVLERVGFLMPERQGVRGVLGLLDRQQAVRISWIADPRQTFPDP